MPTTTFEPEDLLQMDSTQLHQLMETGRPPDPDALVDQQWLGSDLSMPAIGRRLLWPTFRKAFVRDPEHGDVRGVKRQARAARHPLHPGAQAQPRRLREVVRPLPGARRPADRLAEGPELRHLPRLQHRRQRRRMPVTVGVAADSVATPSA